MPCGTQGAGSGPNGLGRVGRVCYRERVSSSLLNDAFDHHAWANLRLIDACLELDPEQLESTAPGTYGSILDTMRHLVGADASYLYVTSEHQTSMIDEDAMDLAELRAAMEVNRDAWTALLQKDLDPERVLERHRDDGSETRAPVGIRLAQALHHGTDHRSQICTTLTTLGIEPPFIDVWDYGQQAGRVTETPPSS
jgi:uncharacterized damage-inducible protein DinB